MRLSALHRKHLGLGATMVEEDGWQRPVRYDGGPGEELRRLRAGCGICDLSPLRKWDAKGSGLRAVPFPGAQGGLPARGKVAPVQPRGMASGPEARESLCYRLADDHALFTAGASDGGLWQEQPSPGVYLTDVTSVLTALWLVGPRSRELLSHLTALNLTERALPHGCCAETQVARCHAVLSRLDVSDLPCYRIFVTRDCAEFVWDSVTDAGRAEGLVPVGIQAWRDLTGGS